MRWTFSEEDRPVVTREPRSTRKQELVAFFGLVLVLLTLLVANRHVLLPVSFRPHLAQSAGVPAHFPAEFPLHPAAVYITTIEAQGQTDGRIYDRAWFAAREGGLEVSGWYRQQLRRDYDLTSSNPSPPRQDLFVLKPQADARVLEMEIFIEPERPTIFFVDFFPTPR